MVVKSWVSSSVLPLIDDSFGCGPEVIGEPHLGPEVNHGSSGIEEVGNLSCLVVHGESVMVVVPSLSTGTETHEDVLTRVNSLIVGSLTPEVSGTVDEPGAVEGPAVPHEGTDEEGCPELLSPAVHGDGSGQEETDQEDQLQVMSSLELQQGVLVEISEVDILALDADVWVLFDHEPAHMCEEESATGIMGVSLGLRVLVVNSVVTGPLDQIILEGDAVAEHEEDPKRCLSLV